LEAKVIGEVLANPKLQKESPAFAGLFRFRTGDFFELFGCVD
jgi:hypothetical protein